MGSALSIKKDLEVWWPVRVPQPVDGGEIGAVEIELLIRVPGSSALRRVLAGTGKTVTVADEDSFAQEHVVGWKKVADEQGDELPFNSTNLEALLDHPGGRTAVLTALIYSGSCLPAAAKKTLPLSPDGGPAAATGPKLN